MGETWVVEEMFGHKPEAFTSAVWKDSNVQKYIFYVVLYACFHIIWGTQTKGAEGEYLEQEEVTGKWGCGKLRSFVIWTPHQISFGEEFKSQNSSTILKIYNTLVLPTFLYGSDNWTLTALQRWRIEVAEMKLLRPLAGYTLYDHKTNDYIRRELRITGLLDNIDEYRRNWISHLQRVPQNRIPLKSYHYRPQGRRTIVRPKKRWREQL